MNIKNILKNNRLCKALTGLNIKEFQALAIEFEWNLKEEIRLRHDKWIRKPGSGKSFSLKTPQEKLFAVLTYLKIYPTFDLLGFMLNLDRSNACRGVQLFMKALGKTLGRKLVLPERKISSIEEFFEKFPEAKEVFLDGTERRVQKPKNLKRRNKLYSGKKKATTRKNLVLSDIDKKILILTPTKSGRRHDKRLADKAQLARNIPYHVELFVDTGFKGIEHEHIKTVIPKKASKKHPLTQEEKDNNKLISSIRVISEHAIGGIKRMKVASDVYRNHLPNLDDMFVLLSAGLWNYHLESR